MKPVSVLNQTDINEPRPSDVIRCYLDQGASLCGQRGLMAFIDHLDDFIIVFDSHGTIFYANPAVCDRLGYAVDEISCMHIEKLFPGLMKDLFAARFSASAAETTFMTTRDLMACDKNRIPVDIKISRGRWQGAEACISVSRDITARVHVEKALRESERRLSTLMSNLPGMAYRCKNNPDRTMEFVSKGCLELTGYRPDEFIDDRVVSWNGLMHPEDRHWVYKKVQETLSRQEFFRLVFRITTRNGEEKWVWEQGVGVYDPQGNVLALEGFITDVTEHQRAREQLHSENILLRSSMKNSYKFCGIVGRSKAMQKVFEMIMRAAESRANVIIYGESGTGKELTARAIHDMSERRNGRFVPVNCSAIPENLIESEFFGYKKGAFSGALGDKPGVLDLADGGTLFLDEVGEIDANLQVKLLRAIEGGGYTPVGGRRVRHPDVRIIAATHAHLKRLVDKHRIREDFFYRIHVIPITIPPLRERKEDLPLLILHFLKTFNGSGNESGLLSQHIMDELYAYDWPGNVRELQNVLQRYITLKKIDLPQTSPRSAHRACQDEGGFLLKPAEHCTLPQAMAGVEKQLIHKTLKHHRWHQGQTAAFLGISYRTLLRKIRQHGLQRHN